VSLRARVSTWRLGRRPIWRKAVARPSCKLRRCSLSQTSIG